MSLDYFHSIKSAFNSKTASHTHNLLSYSDRTPQLCDLERLGVPEEGGWVGAGAGGRGADKGTPLSKYIAPYIF